MDLIKNYLSGEKINLYQKVSELSIEINFEEKFPTNFAQKVMKFLAENVSYGKTTTYSDIGKAIGSKAEFGGVVRATETNG